MVFSLFPRCSPLSLATRLPGAHPSPSPTGWVQALAISLGTVTATLLGLPEASWAAEEIRASFGVFQVSVPVESLETYVKEGVIDSEFRPYARYFSQERLEELRQLLGTPIEVDRDAMTNFLYTDPGEVLLQRLGTVLRTRKNNGFLAIRAALVLSVWEEENGTLTPINALKKFPTESLVIDVDEGLSITRGVEQLIRQTSEAIALVKTEFQASVSTTETPFPTFHTPGPYDWERATTGITFLRRAFPLNIYFPNRQDAAPIVVISHGLGSNLESYRYLAEHLASHGFVVVVPEHEGSNAEHIQALLTGSVDNVAEPDEFINRTNDISFILNGLERLVANDPDYRRELDLENIGVIGQSFGGYTALALAGANFDFDNLATYCPEDEDLDDGGTKRSFNLSLILQCRALSLRNAPVFQTQPSLADDRIDAAIAINPIGSAIFGERGMEAITVPTMIMTGTADVVAPTLWEQLSPFSWLNTPDKFLLMMHQGTHFSTIGITEDDVPLPDAIRGPVPQTAQRYVKAMSLGFFQTYLDADDAEERAAVTLSPNYVQHLSTDAMPLSLIQQFDLGQID